VEEVGHDVGDVTVVLGVLEELLLDGDAPQQVGGQRGGVGLVQDDVVDASVQGFGVDAGPPHLAG